MDEYAKKSVARLNEVMSRMDVYRILEMPRPRKWPFSKMDVDDEVSFYPICLEATRAVHSYAQSCGKKFSCRTEWPLTVIKRVS